MAVTIQEALSRASSFLKLHDVEQHQFAAELLLRHVLGITREKLFTMLTDPLPERAESAYQIVVERRASGEPVQYIIGQQEFYGLLFRVTPAVLIPRPETEILVEEVSKRIPRIWQEGSLLTATDIGTGSGAIAVSLAVHHPQLQVVAVDISPDALCVAEENAGLHNVGSRVKFVKGDLLQPLLAEGKKADIIVSNPPYIPSADIKELDIQVRGHEPGTALDGGADGLDYYRSLAEGMPLVLRSPGLAAVEVGIGQADRVKEMFMATDLFNAVEVINDLAGIGRVVIGKSSN